MRKTVLLLTTIALVVSVSTTVGATERATRGDLSESPTVTPSEGPPGTTFTVSGTCEYLGTGDVVVEVDTKRSGNPSTTPEEAAATPDDNGDWSVEFTVDEQSPPGDQVRIGTECNVVPTEAGPSAARSFRAPPPTEYRDVFFLVTADPTLTLTPDSGLPGSEFSVSGRTCPSLYEGMVTVTDGTTEKVVAPDADNTWTAGPFTAPKDAEVGDEITVEATCQGTEIFELRGRQGIRRQESGFSLIYDPATFTVITEPTTTTTTGPTGEVDNAAAAQPTVAKPTFTG